MKTLKSLFMLCAGLSFCACSSDDEVPTLAKEGAVEVTIVPPTTRTVGDGSGNVSTIKVVGDMYVTLEYNGNSVTKKIAQSEVPKVVKFWGVTNPTKVSVSMNGGQLDYSSVSITNNTTISESYVDEAEQEQTDSNVSFNMQAAPANIPVYGEVGESGIVLKDRVETHDETNYQMYDATVTLKIPVARLEVSAKRLAESTLFNTLNLKGAYLDNIKPTNGGAFTDYKHPLDESTTVSGQTSAILFDTHETPIAFVGADVTAPGNSQYYVYNFYGKANAEDANYENPEVKLYFTNVTAKTGTVPANQYAIINSYKNAQDQVISLENGKVYKITDITLADSNVGPVESGDELAYAVEVTVEEAVWSVETTTGVWAGTN